VLSEEGYRQLRRHGHAQAATACGDVAATDVRFVDAGLEREVAGADENHCLALFAAPRRDLPAVLHREVDAGAVRVELRVPPDLRALAGHFAALPIVPGVIHVAWALHFARADLGVTGALAGMDQVKFRHIVQPGHQLTLTVTWHPQRGELSFRLGTADTLFSGGRLVLEARDA